MCLFACGYTHKTAAPIIGCDAKTLRKVFSRECAAQDQAALIVRSGLMAQLIAEGEKGNVGAIKQLEAMLEREQTRVLGSKIKDRGAEKPAPKGKKEEQQQAAENVGGKFATREPPPLLIN